MNTLPISKPYNTQYNNINFRCNKFYTAQEIKDAAIVSNKEVSEGLEKLTKKIKFVNQILGKNDKTNKPVSTQIGDAFVFINMDKTTKGKTKINIFSDTPAAVFSYSGIENQYKKIETPNIERQSLNIVISDKDGRMCNGTLSTIDDNCTTFERNIKTGKRKAEGKYFIMVPNINECKDQKFEMNDFGYNKTTLTIRNIFSQLFNKLSLVKPEINLTK